MSVTTAAGTCPYSGIDFADPDLSRTRNARPGNSPNCAAPPRALEPSPRPGDLRRRRFLGDPRHRDVQEDLQGLRTVVHQRQGRHHPAARVR